jgi:hypothetical protein
MPTLISVDYDFLVPHGMFEKSIKLGNGDSWPGDLVYDWQMGEGRSPALDRVVWETRCQNFKMWGLDIVEMSKPKMTPEYFIRQISGMTGAYTVPAWYADSHAWAAVIARDLSEQYGALNVVNFDAHHDLGYTTTYGQVDEIMCDNWALASLQQGHIENYTVVYPDWLGKVEIAPSRLKLLKPVKDRITITTFSEWLKGDEIDDLEAAFFCRSSSWVPPWLDPGFQQMLEEYGCAECLDCRYEQMCSPHDACTPREWDWDEVHRSIAERSEHVRLLTGYISMGKLEP